MESIEWWASLEPETKDWLIAHNGEALPERVLAEVVTAGGDVTSNAWWVGEQGRDGFFLSDEAVDWIEAVGNAEAP